MLWYGMEKEKGIRIYKILMFKMLRGRVTLMGYVSKVIKK